MAELKSNVEWKQWGKEDPLWGVASWANKQKDGTSPWTEEEFYGLGRSDWMDFLAHWRQYGVDTKSCLEIGCGAGRITRQLAKTFDHVSAVDVSDHMIGIARAAMADCKNVEFFLIDGLTLPQADCAVTAIFSTHVLQHLDSADVGFSYFREFFRVLEVGGSLMIHLPLYQFPSDVGGIGFLMRSFYAISRQLSNVQAGAKRRLGIKTMRGTPYSIRSLNCHLCDLGFKNIEFRIFSPKSNGDSHPFIFATK